MEPMETVIVVVLVSIIVLGTFASAWYFLKNLRHFRDEVAKGIERERRLRDGSANGDDSRQGPSAER